MWDVVNNFYLILLRYKIVHPYSAVVLILIGVVLIWKNRVLSEKFNTQPKTIKLLGFLLIILTILLFLGYLFLTTRTLYLIGT